MSWTTADEMVWIGRLGEHRDWSAQLRGHDPIAWKAYAKRVLESYRASMVLRRRAWFHEDSIEAALDRRLETIEAVRDHGGGANGATIE